MTREQIIQQSQSERYDYPDIFTDKIGLDLVDPKGLTKVVPSWGKCRTRNNKRKVLLCITTFCGISFDAIHYYAELKVQGVEWEYKDEPGTFTWRSDKKEPLVHYSYDLQLTRPLTEEEMKKEPDRWEYYHVGSLVRGFEHLPEMFDLAKEVFNTRFEGEWDFAVDAPYNSLCGDFEEVYNRVKKNKDDSDRVDS